MLSILIPTYNTNTKKITESLHQQGLDLNLPFELLVVDDHSPNPAIENEDINDLRYASYHSLAENLGRSKIRNYLADKAKYPYLLFIDGDMGVEKQGFLKDYVAVLADKVVVCGGHYYQELAPKQENLRLHWHYGRTREARTAKERNINPYKGFVPSNFIIPKSIFLGVKFEEKIQGYGHEDTLFGDLLKKQNIQILHLDNALIHEGLETNTVFLRKVKSSVQNLIKLESNYQFKTTRLQQAAEKYKWLKPIIKRIPTGLLKKLILKSRRLWLVDIYKLVIYYSG